MLQVPGELRMIEIAGDESKHVGVNRDGRVLEIDQNFDLSVIFAGGKSEQGMIVEAQGDRELFRARRSLARNHCTEFSSQFPVLNSQRETRTEN